MYRRDHDDLASSAADPSSSFPSDCWPPPRRSTQFRPSTTAGSKFSTDPLSSAAGASDPFRHQGKSSDHVIQQLRDELDKHRQMFFDRVGPQWSESTPQRVSFLLTALPFCCCFLVIRNALEITTATCRDCE